MFHWKDGWYFGRKPSGDVRIIHVKGATAGGLALDPLFPPMPESFDVDITIDADSWASIVSSVSAGGEQDLRFFTALAFHHSRGAWSLAEGVGKWPPAKLVAPSLPAPFEVIPGQEIKGGEIIPPIGSEAPLPPQE